MQKKDFMIACQKEYTSRKLLITGISLQTKESGKEISYDTTHSAFIYPLSGTAIISFLYNLSYMDNYVKYYPCKKDCIKKR